jgi:DNA polymerase-3 subunit beta
MKLTMTKSELIRSLSRVQGVIERRNTLPVLSYVLIKARGSAVEVLSTDLEVGIKATYQADVAEPGTITLMAKKAFEIAREMPGEEVNLLSEANNWVRITSGKATFRVVGLPPEDFPDLPVQPATDGIAVDRQALMEMIQTTSFAISHDQQRYALNGLLLVLTPEEGEGGRQICRLVSTDGHRLALAERPILTGCTEEKNVIIPRKGVMELKKILDDEIQGDELKVDVQGNHVFFMGERVVLAARLIEGQFPEYRQVVPAEHKRVAVMDREEFNGVLRRVSILTADRNTPVKFAFGSGQLNVSAASNDLGEAEESMAIQYDGEPVEVGFNARYLLDFLSAVGGPQVTLSLSEPLAPGLFTIGARGVFKYVVMPMRL